MKKLLPALLVLLAIGAGGGALYLFQKQARGGGASTAAVAFLPADTLLLLSVPDLDKTCADWKTTDLYKIWTEPEVQAFLAKPLSKIPAHPDLDNTLTQIAKLDPSNLFVALTSLDEKNNNQPHVVGGFQFKGTSAEVDRLLAGVKSQLKQNFPAGKSDLVNYQGHSIETFDAGENNSLESVYLGDWYFVSNDLSLLKTTIDRVDRRAPTDQPMLDKDADYQSVTAKLPSGPNTLIFARAKVFIRRILDLAAASGQPVDPQQRVEAEKVRALGATTKIEGGKIRDTIYCLSPGVSQEYSKLAMGSLPLTTADTVFYAASMLNIPARMDLPPDGGAAGGPGAGGFALLKGLAGLLEEKHVTLESFRAAFGNEAGLQLDWKAGDSQPALIASLDVRDPAAAGKFVDSLTAAFSSDAKWQVSQADGLVFHTMTIPNSPFLSPTLTVTDKHLILGLNTPQVRDAAMHEKTAAANFTQSDAYKGASAQVEKANVSFAYLDSRAFFERSYTALRPMALLGAAFLLPQASEYVDLGKLPNTETISKHLSPTVLSYKTDSQGLLIESVGSFTFGQAVVSIVSGATAAAAPYLQSQLTGAKGGFPTLPSGNADDSDTPPAGTPSASAQPTAGE